MSKSTRFLKPGEMPKIKTEIKREMSEYEWYQCREILIQAWGLAHFQSAGVLCTPEVAHYLDILKDLGLFRNTGIIGSNIDCNKKEKYPLYRLTEIGRDFSHRCFIEKHERLENVKNSNRSN